MRIIKNDHYRRARGGNTKILAISCTNCDHQLCQYQKDGIGALKRLYFDRFIGSYPNSNELRCSQCGALIGTKMLYQKEKRLAYRLKPNMIHKAPLRR